MKRKPGIVLQITGKSGKVEAHTFPLPKGYEALIKQSEKMISLVDEFMLSEDKCDLSLDK